MPSVFVLEHGRLWLVAQRGYAVVPDGITMERGSPAARSGSGARSSHPTSAPTQTTSPRSLASSRSSPFRCARVASVVGVLNIESERALPDGAVPGGAAPRSRAGTTRRDRPSGRTLDLAALARLFVHLGSLREPLDIAALGAASLPKVLPVTESQIVIWSELGTATELAAWEAADASHPLSLDDIEIARAQSDPSVVCQVLALEGERRVAVANRRLASAPGERGRARGARGDLP